MFRVLFVTLLVGVASAAPYSDKVCPHLKELLSAQDRANVVVSFDQDTSGILNRINNMEFESRGAKITALKTNLEELQTASQKNAWALLSSLSVKFHAVWINNKIYIEDATKDTVVAIAALPEVAHVRKEFIASIVESTPIGSTAVEWNIERIEADKAWNLTGGTQGEGAVVANIDTGVRGTHEALQDHHRSSYGWFDPYDGSEAPFDANGHGTHTMGIIAGSGGIGVAPKAQWISCRGCSTASCTEASLVKCGQWLVCPTLTDGRSPNCSLAPGVVSNSWGGGQGSVWYDAVIDAWHAASIVPVFGIGSGSACGSAGSPGDSPNVIGVGATTATDEVSGFTGRGPSSRDEGIKPDIVAPGQDIRSAWATSDTTYLTISGTSMSAPHISGTVALLLATNPNLTFRQVKDLLQNNADRYPDVVESCGNIPPGDWPNNVYGHGRVNARKSLSALIDG